jgi:hypothetical protein
LHTDLQYKLTKAYNDLQEIYIDNQEELDRINSNKVSVENINETISYLNSVVDNINTSFS